MSALLLSVDTLTLGIGTRRFCEGLSFRVGAGERWAVVGPNGAGKTTLLRALAGLASPLAGSIRYGEEALAALPARERARRVAVLPQDSSDPFPATALETVLVARHPHLDWFEWESNADVSRARAALAAFGLQGFEARDVRTLSGGERRRVALAALVAQETPLLLLDEPSSHLDIGQQSAALDVLVELAAKEGRALLMVLHDIHLATRYCDHAIALGDGHAEAGDASAILTVDRLSTLFHRPLVELRDGSLRAFVPR
jgi:iron complex transport system ATP-binding protein